MKLRKMFCLLLAAVPLAAFADSGTVTRTSQVLAAPYSDAEARGTLEANEGVEIVERQGGWYHVRAEDGRDGWLRLSSIRLGAAKEEEESGGFWASLFSFTGRSGTRTASATTGIRGLSEEEIKDATPNPEAVEGLARFAPDENEARSFAGEIGLKSQDVKPLPAVVKAKKGGR